MRSFLLLLLLWPVSFSVWADEQCLTDMPTGQAVQQLSSEANQIKRQLDCSGIPTRFLRTSNERSGPVDYVGNCLMGVIKGVIANIKLYFSSILEVGKFAVKFVAKFGDTMWKFLKAAYYGAMATFWAEFYAEGTQLVRDLAESILNIPQTLQAVAERQLNNWGCLSNRGRTEYICKTVYRMVTVPMMAKYALGQVLARTAAAKALMPAAQVLK
jgi:hypothetical protein